VKPIDDRQTAFLIFQNNIEIESITVNGLSINLEQAGLLIDKIQDMSGSTAQHVRGGCCFVFNGTSDLSGLSDLSKEHDLVSITSSILDALDIESEPYMQSPVTAVVNAIKNQPRPRDYTDASATDITERKIAEVPG